MTKNIQNTLQFKTHFFRRQKLTILIQNIWAEKGACSKRGWISVTLGGQSHSNFVSVSHFLSQSFPSFFFTFSFIKNDYLVPLVSLVYFNYCFSRWDSYKSLISFHEIQLCAVFQPFSWKITSESLMLTSFLWCISLLFY